jgi:hypothetical protein
VSTAWRFRPSSRRASTSSSTALASGEFFHAPCQSVSVVAVAPAPMTSRMYSALCRNELKFSTVNQLPTGWRQEGMDILHCAGNNL